MPIYYFICPECSLTVVKLLTPHKAKTIELTCGSCTAILERNPQPPTSSVKEVIDNGLQARRVEQFANSPELLEEREQLDRDAKNKTGL